MDWREFKRAIYKITNTVTGMSYIGQTTRKMKHRYQIEWWKSVKNKLLLSHINHYGKDVFTIEVLHHDVYDLDTLEKSEIIKNNSLYPNGYNFCNGGQARLCTPPETKAAQYIKIKNSLTGRKRSDSECLAISKGKIGKSLSKEHKNSISKAKKGVRSPIKGYRLGRHNVSQFVKIECNNGLIFDTIKDFESYFKVSNISAVLNKRRKSLKFNFIKKSERNYFCEVL